MVLYPAVTDRVINADAENSSSPTPSCATWRWQNGYSSFECDMVSFSADVLSAKEWVLPQKISATTSATSAASAVKTSGTATTSTTAPPPKAPDQKKSNTIPIIAGVVVGVLLVFALILVLLARYKKKRKEAAQQQQQQGPSELYAAGGVMGGEFYKPDQKAGPISPIEEMPGDRRLMAAELTSSAEIVELPGDGRGSRTEIR
jgi:preprotein translocase subunit SecG